jgi:phosphohistidine phosphatase
MEIYLLRHGKAEQRGPGKRDADRKLTPDGKRGVRETVSRLRKARIEPDRIFTSGLRRADETAAIAAEIFPNSPTVVTKSLEPSADPASIWKELLADPAPARVMLVGHEPHLSQLVGFLLGVPAAVNFKKAAIVCIEAAKDHPQGTLQWMLTPRLAKTR